MALGESGWGEGVLYGWACAMGPMCVQSSGFAFWSFVFVHWVRASVRVYTSSGPSL